VGETRTGRTFALTHQVSVIWFGSDGAQYSLAKALFSDDNLLIAQPLAGVNEAIDLVQQHAKSEDKNARLPRFAKRRPNEI
jgi:hypothetical protein